MAFNSGKKRNKTIDTSAFDGLKEFETRDNSTAYCQLVNPERLSSEKKIRDSNCPYGVFIPLEQAERVSFTPTGWFQRISLTFNEDSPNPATVQGYITKRLRCCIIHQSDTIELQEKTARGWFYKGPAYKYGKPTKYKELLDGDRENYRMRTRYLLLFVDEDNNPLHEVPLQLGLGAGTGGAIGSEVASLRDEFNQAYSEATGNKGVALEDEVHSLTVLDMELDFHKSQGKSPFVVPIRRLHPVTKAELIDVEQEKENKGRIVTLIGEPFNNILIPKGSKAGELIFSLRETYSDFPIPNGGAEEDDTSSKSSDASNQENDTASWENDPDFFEKCTPTPQPQEKQVSARPKPVSKVEETEVETEEEETPIPF
ncbi:DUF5895 domain-containing protein [Cyanothece sp. BG0011]|uniref:DUF5895 domain-containing protein n=1 Tax=Cyanothece sp. BG0011 TaxID=2082950 RepID=UPI000D1F11F1|nr:DUF5895 domain-containing protein [Cyanothece sp. BG0011]